MMTKQAAYLLMAMLLPWFAQAQKKEEDYAKAKELLANKRWAEARAFANNCLQEDDWLTWPSYIAAQSYLGELYEYKPAEAECFSPAIDSIAFHLQRLQTGGFDKKSRKKERFLFEDIIRLEEPDSARLMAYGDSVMRMAERYMRQTCEIHASMADVSRAYFACQTLFFEQAHAYSSPRQRYLSSTAADQAQLKEIAACWQRLEGEVNEYSALFSADTLDRACNRHQQSFAWHANVNEDARNFQPLVAVDFQRDAITITDVRPWADSMLFHIGRVQELRAQFKALHQAIAPGNNADSLEEMSKRWMHDLGKYDPDLPMQALLDYGLASMRVNDKRTALSKKRRLFFIDKHALEPQLNALMAEYERCMQLLYLVRLDEGYYDTQKALIDEFYGGAKNLAAWQQEEQMAISAHIEALKAEKFAAMSLARIAVDSVRHGEWLFWLRPSEETIANIYGQGRVCITEQAFNLPDASFLLRGRVKDSTERIFLAKITPNAEIKWMHLFASGTDSVANITTDGGKGDIYALQRVRKEWQLALINAAGAQEAAIPLPKQPSALYTMTEPPGAFLLWEDKDDEATALHWAGISWEKKALIAQDTLVIEGNVARIIALFNTIKIAGNYHSITGWDGQAIASQASDGGLGTNVFVAHVSLLKPWSLHLLKRNITTYISDVLVEPGGFLQLQGYQGSGLKKVGGRLEGGIPWQEYAE